MSSKFGIHSKPSANSDAYRNNPIWDKKGKPKEEHETSHDDLGSMLIYAARYAHTRNTGAAMQVVNCAVKNWDSLKEEHRVQLAKETKDATCNFEDWNRLLNLFNGSWD